MSLYIHRLFTLFLLSVALMGGTGDGFAQTTPTRPPDRIRTHADPTPPPDLSQVEDGIAAPPVTGEERRNVQSLGPARALPEPPEVVLFVLDRVGLSDIFAADAPHLQAFFRETAMGLMNFTSSLGRNMEGSYATMGAGMRAVAVPEGGLFREADEPFESGPAWGAFLRRTGLRPSPGSALNLGIAPLLKANEEKDTGASVWAMGLLASANGPAAIIGNSDTPEPGSVPLRFAPLLAMRPSGVVDRGEISAELLRPDSTAPYGVSTDPSKLQAAYDRLSPGASLVVVDLGETTRADAYQKYLPPSSYRENRLRAIARADELFARVMGRVNLERTRVMVVSPIPPTPDEGGITQLAPMAISGMGKGLLRSPTTQGNGLVANLDVAPTVGEILFPTASPRTLRRASLQNARPEGLLMTGAPITVTAWSDPLSYLRRLDAAVIAQRQAASGPFLPILAAMAVLLGMIGLGIALPRPPALRSRAVRFLGRFALCGVVMLPLALVVTGEQMPGTLGRLIATSALAWIVLTFFPLMVGKPAVPTAMLACGLGILTNLMSGGLGLRLSPISDFPIIGIRFHGLANEYMGLAIGMTLMGAMSLTDFFPQLIKSRIGTALLWFLFLLSTAIVGLPSLGDNAGGFITAVFAFGVAILGIYGLPLNGKSLLALLATAFGLLWIIAIVDSIGTGPTHFGRSVLLMREGGIGYLFDIVMRKLAINLSFMADPRAWLTCAGIFLLAYYGLRHERSRILALLTQRPGLAMGLSAALVGSVAAWVFNDTGIVPAALLLSAAFVGLVSALMEAPRRTAPDPLIRIRLD